jgi:hypothetical protein
VKIESFGKEVTKLMMEVSLSVCWREGSLESEELLLVEKRGGQIERIFVKKREELVKREPSSFLFSLIVFVEENSEIHPQGHQLREEREERIQDRTGREGGRWDQRTRQERAENREGGRQERSGDRARESRGGEVRWSTLSRIWSTTKFKLK